MTAQDSDGSLLFSPLKLRGLTLPNRVIVSPMSQYSADGGSVGYWHVMHLGKYAVAGNGLVILEATAVSKEGRITAGCPGLYNDDNEAAMASVIKFTKDYGNSPMAVQLGHAGRKGSLLSPWMGARPATADEEGGWQTYGPSEVPHSDIWPLPKALDDGGIAKVKADWVQAAERSARVGFDLVEIHMAHGFLLHQFLSPLSNKRNDQYGGSLENRMRFPLEIFDAVRAAWPEDKPLGVRISATDWVPGGWALEDSIVFAQELDKRGCDYIDISSGGSSLAQEITPGPGYQVPFAAAIKEKVEMPVMAVGLITDAHQAEEILASGKADMIALGRGLLYDPHWAWHAATELGDQTAYPPQYARAHPSLSGTPNPGNPPKPTG